MRHEYLPFCKRGIIQYIRFQDDRIIISLSSYKNEYYTDKYDQYLIPLLSAFQHGRPVELRTDHCNEYMGKFDIFQVY